MRTSGLVALIAQLAFASSQWEHTRAARPSPANLPLIPEPLDYTYGTGETPLCLLPDFQIQLPDELMDGDGDLARAAHRTMKALLAEMHQYLSVERGREFWTDVDQNDAAQTKQGLRECTHWLTELHLILDHSDKSINVTDEERYTITGGAMAEVELRPALERYETTVPVGGQATIKASTALGLFRGLTTFEQLFYHLEDDDGWDTLSDGNAVCHEKRIPAPALANNLRQLVDGSEWEDLITRLVDDDAKQSTTTGRVYAPFAPYHITDGPKFGWRGLMLDTSRNFYPISAIEKTLNTMAMAKLNVFHWHITDSETWPLDLAAYPEIARASAYSAKARYSEAQVQGIMQYAGERGIDVLIEVDMPGHTASLAYSHPEHIACFGKYWDKYAAKPPAGQMRYANEETEDFMKGYVSELVEIVHGRYVGTGGDEPSQRCMDDDEPTQQALKRRNITLDEALDSFVGAVHEPIRKAKKTPVVWQESVLDHGDMPSLHNHSQGGGVPLVHVWLDPTNARQVLDKGFKAIHNTGQNFYLDCGHGGWISTNNGTDNCPYRTWQKILSFDPYQNITKEQQESGGIIGGQVNLWSEQSDEQNLGSTIWPRAAALGELFWGGDRGKGYPRDARPSMAGMHDLRYRMVERGVRANALQPHWCAIRPGECAHKEEE